MKLFAIIICTTLITISSSHADVPISTICKSSSDEMKFKELAGTDIQVLAVCPKKGIYFVEIKADGNDIDQFAKNIKQSNMNLTKISIWKKNTKIGSMVLMVEFNY